MFVFGVDGDRVHFNEIEMFGGGSIMARALVMTTNLILWWLDKL